MFSIWEFGLIFSVVLDFFHASEAIYTTGMIVNCLSLPNGTSVPGFSISRGNVRDGVCAHNQMKI
jgi:hypothetical protein